jgi:GMP synthase-like glutamine amidotransferase
MKLLVVDNGTSYLRELLALFSEHEVMAVTRRGFSKEAAASCDAVVLSGGHSFTVSEHDREYANELDYIKNGSRPIIGICLGFELIAHAFGATLERLGENEKGIIKIKAVCQHPILSGLSEIEVYESHRWVIKNVQSPLVELASSRDGCEVVAHETKPIFGFQFHPEMFPDKTTGKAIIKNCLKYIIDGCK